VSPLPPACPVVTAPGYSLSAHFPFSEISARTQQEGTGLQSGFASAATSILHLLPVFPGSPCGTFGQPGSASCSFGMRLREPSFDWLFVCAVLISWSQICFFLSLFLLQVIIPVVFLSYRIKKLKVFEFKLLSRGGSSNTPARCSMKCL
jgi:hypothetical protein